MDDEEDCDAELLYTFLERVISLRRYPAPDDRNVETDAGIVSGSRESTSRYNNIKVTHAKL